MTIVWQLLFFFLYVIEVLSFFALKFIYPFFIQEEKRIQRLHPSDAKYNCDQIENELKHVEESLKSMTKDIQTLRDGRYHQTSELQKR